MKLNLCSNEAEFTLHNLGWLIMVISEISNKQPPASAMGIYYPRQIKNVMFADLLIKLVN